MAMTRTPVKCPECGNLKGVWRKGLVPSREGPKQRYVCFNCGGTFYKPKEKPKPVRKPKKKVAKKQVKVEKQEVKTEGGE